MSYSTVSDQGIPYDGNWYYHPNILLRYGDSVMISVDKGGETATIYDLDGAEWIGKAVRNNNQ